MEEADILSSKIGIMAKGVLRCLGSPLHLKRKYGKGFKLTISFYKEADRQAVLTAKPDLQMKNQEDALRWIESVLPKDKWKKLEQGGVQGSVTYEFDTDDTNEKGVVTSLLDEMQLHKDELGIEDWGISLATLEEVFLSVIAESDELFEG
jgi:ABC-type multidrug transport system ATPase subunit